VYISSPFPETGFMARVLSMGVEVYESALLIGQDVIYVDVNIT
jgi:hypothetical protein